MNANVFIHAQPNRKIGLKGIWLKMSWMPKVTQTKYLKFAHKCAHQCVFILALFLHYIFWNNCLLHKTPNCFTNYVWIIINLRTINMMVKLYKLWEHVIYGTKSPKYLILILQRKRLWSSLRLNAYHCHLKKYSKSRIHLFKETLCHLPDEQLGYVWIPH